MLECKQVPGKKWKTEVKKINGNGMRKKERERRGGGINERKARKKRKKE